MGSGIAGGARAVGLAGGGEGEFEDGEGRGELDGIVGGVEELGEGGEGAGRGEDGEELRALAFELGDGVGVGGRHGRWFPCGLAAQVREGLSTQFGARGRKLRENFFGVGRYAPTMDVRQTNGARSRAGTESARALLRKELEDRTVDVELATDGLPGSAGRLRAEARLAKLIQEGLDSGPPVIADEKFWEEMDRRVDARVEQMRRGTRAAG